MRQRLALLLTAAIIPLALAAQAVDGDGPTYREHQDLSYYLDARGARHPIRSIADWTIRRAQILVQMQTVMGPLPHPARPVPLDVRMLESVSLGPIVRRKIDYHTDSPSRRVSAYLFVPAKASAKLPAVLCLHQTINIGKSEPAGLGTSPDLRYALHLAQRGYVTLAPDYPSFGEYAYDFDPKDGYVSGTMKAIYDNIRVIDLLQTLPEVDGDRIGCIGHSLGGHNSIFTAAFDPRIKAVVSNCGFTRFHKYYGGKLKGWTSPRYMPRIAGIYGNDPDRVPFDFTEVIAALAPRAFLASAPIHDDNFDVSGVRDVIAAAKPIYALYGKQDNLAANYPACHHAFPPAAREVAYSFLDRHLK
ncbi:MAG TPA: alpha/beta fold hydrolase [Planctomycetaceae bacterium]|jgi:dienelactone hydrolase|nr:alpha/beta fold hydrolase [Planctomycetaceae bacterium]